MRASARDRLRSAVDAYCGEQARAFANSRTFF
jgi:hypothetical protein